MDRLGKIVGGLGSAVEAPFGLVADLATMHWNDDEEFNGFWHTLAERGGTRGGQFLSGAFGADSGIGAAIGAVPKGIRSPIHSVLAPVGEGFETAYREGIGEPISTAVTAASLSSSPIWRREQGRGEFTAMFDPDTWKKAHAIAQHRGPGAAVGLAVFTSDVLDPKQVEAATHSDGYKILSTVTDGVTRWKLDPTVLAGKGVQQVRTHGLDVGDRTIVQGVRPLTGKEDFDKIEASSRFGRVVQAMDGMGAAEIRHRFFPNDVHGAVIAATLADAGDAATRAKALRLFMGDLTARDALRTERADIAAQIDRLTGRQTILAAVDDGHFARANFGSDDAAAGALARLDTELDLAVAEDAALTDRAAMLARQDAAFKSLAAQPRDRFIDRKRVAITRHDTYQHSLRAGIVRRATVMQPHNLIDLNRAEGDVQVQRQARSIGFSIEDQDKWRNEYMRAWSPATRAAVLVRMEDAGIRHIAAEAKMTEDEVRTVLQRANQGRGTTREILKGRAYDAGDHSVYKFVDDDGVLNEIQTPLLVSQTANTLPLTDFREARRALTKVAEFRRRHPKTDLPGDLLEGFYRVWKPSVLLRVGWPVRVVGDEQLRIMAKIGALAQMKNFTAGIGNAGHNMVERARAQAEGRAPELRGIGFQEVKHGDVTLPSAFGTRDAPNPYYTLSSSHAVFENAFETVEQTHLRQLRGVAASHRTLMPEEASHAPAWLDALNNQLGRDELGRIFLNGGDVEDGVRFLRSPEGRAYAAQVPERRKDLTKWAGMVKDQVDRYTMGDLGLMSKALKSKVTTEDLFAVAPNPAMRPLVHGPELEEALGRGFTAKYVQPLVQAAYKGLGSVPTDTLSRHPFFDAMYRAEAGRRVDLLDAQLKAQGKRISADDIDEIAQASREYALSQTRHLLYDLQEQSELAHTLRFLMPFYSAWQETMTRWAGLAVENPAYIARMRMVWNAPEKAGLVTDENGNPVAYGEHTGDRKTVWTGTYDQQGNKVMQEVELGRERKITFIVPKQFQKQFRGLTGTGQVTFNKKSANLVLQGAPGFGPAVQLPVNEIVKDRPELEASVRWALPFGAQQSTIDMILPATVKRISARVRGEQDRAYTNAAMRLWNDQLVNYNLGRRADKPSWQEALRDTNSFFNLRTVASFVSPVAPGFQSPYQPYIDAYRRKRLADPENADQWFIDTYGEEFFPLTQSLSKSRDGVPPTVEAFKARSKYKDLIEKHPDLGGLIVGAEGAGAFSNGVYKGQFEKNVAPGSTDKQREQLSFEEVSSGSDVRLGWIEYSNAMDLIDKAQHDRGLPNLRVKGAEDLAQAKRQITQLLGVKHPEWWGEFNKQDRLAMQNRIDGLRELAADERMGQRPEFQGLQQYFAAREQVRKILTSRESKTLDSASNTDIAEAWESITSLLAERNPAFGALFHRYLDRDMLEAA